MTATPVVTDARVEKWLAPITPEAPAGNDCMADPRYAAIVVEVEKLSSPSASGTDWKKILDTGADVLTTSSKDFKLTAYVALALQVMGGVDGLCTGLSLLTGMMDRFWAAAYPRPERMRARVNLLSWWTEQAGNRLNTVAEVDQASFERLQASLKMFSTSMSEKFGGQAPSIAPLREGMERLRMRVTAPAAPVAPAAPAPQPAAPGESQPVAPPPAPAVPQAQQAQPVPAPAQVMAPSAPVRSLAEAGKAIQEEAANRRKASPMDPDAYRLMRVGMWLTVKLPPAEANGATKANGVDPSLRTNLETVKGNGNWAALLDLAEAASSRSVFSLDLQRFVATALKQLGPGYAPCLEAVQSEVGSLVKRLPRLREMSDVRGAPFADAETKAWLDSEVVQAGPSQNGSPAAASSSVSSVRAASEAAEDFGALLQGRSLKEAAATIQERASSARSGESRFRLRLAMAEIALKTGKIDFAQAVYDELEKECLTRGLDEWAPELASVYLKGHLECLRAIAKQKKQPVGDAGALYRRLCRIDLTTAVDLT